MPKVYIYEQKGERGLLTGFPPEKYMADCKVFEYHKCCLDKKNYQRGVLLGQVQFIQGLANRYAVVCAKCGTRMFAMDWYELSEPDVSHA